MNPFRKFDILFRIKNFELEISIITAYGEKIIKLKNGTNFRDNIKLAFHEFSIC